MNLSSACKKILARGIACVAVIGLGLGVCAANAQAAPSGKNVLAAESVLKAVDAWDHPALRPLEKAVPSPVLIVPNRDRWVNRLSSDRLYSVVNNNIATNIRDVYELIPDGWGGFLYRSAVKPRGGISNSVYSSAMGTDEQGRTTLYYTEALSSSRYKIKKAVNGTRAVQELPEVNTVGSGCLMSNLGVAPNGSLWISSGWVGSGNNAGKNTLSLVNPNGTTTASQSFEPAKGTAPLKSNHCIHAGVFDEAGNYYVRVGEGNNSSSDDIVKLDLSEFPAKVTYTREDFPIFKRGQGLAWHDGGWWSAPPRDCGREPLYGIDPTSGMVSNATIPGLSPYFTVSSTSLVPAAKLSVSHTADRYTINTAADRVVSYEVTVKNDVNAEGSYSGPVIVDLGGSSVLRHQYQQGSAEVVDRDGVQRNAGRIVDSAADSKKLTWFGNIPNGGQLSLKYEIRFDIDNVGGNFVSTVLPFRSWPSNCSAGEPLSAQCAVTVRVYPSETEG